MVVINLISSGEYELLKEKLNKHVIFFWAQWHEPSKKGGQMQGIFKALSEKYQTINFYLVEAEIVPELSEKLEVTKVPTFVAYFGKDFVGKVEGVNPADLSNLVKSLSIAESSSFAITEQSGSTADLNVKLDKLINSAPVMLFMKGTPSEPKCGFSRQIVEILKTNAIPFASFNILTDEEVRAGLKVYSDWPTYPQLYVKGALVGGLDILKEMQSSDNFKAELGVDSLQLPPAPPSMDERLKALVNRADVMVFIKGSPSSPKCGFSQTLVALLNKEGVAFDHFDILTDEEVRAGLKVYSDWPTYPQLYVKGVLMGGLDIVKEMQEAGDLKTQLGI